MSDSGRPTSPAISLISRVVACEAAHLQLAVQEHCGDIGAVQQVLHVVAGAREVVQLGLQFGVHRLQFLVQRLHLFLRGGQFLVDGLLFFAGGLQLLVG